MKSSRILLRYRIKKRKVHQISLYTLTFKEDLQSYDNLFMYFTWLLMAVFILGDALSVWTNLGKHSLFVSSVKKTGTRRIIRPDELSSVVRHSSRTTEDSSSRRIMRLVPVFTLLRDE